MSLIINSNDELLLYKSINLVLSFTEHRLRNQNMKKIKYINVYIIYKV